MAFWDPLSGLFSDVTGRIRQLVSDAIQAVIDWFSTLYNNIVTWVTAIYAWAVNAVNGVISWLGNVAVDVGRLVVRVWNDIPGIIGNWVDYVIARAKDLADAVRARAEEVWQQIYVEVNNVERWAIGAIWTPLLGFIQDTQRWVTGTIVPQITGLFGSLLSPITGTINALTEIIDSIRAAYDVVVRDVIPVVRGAARFLVFVAEHPFTWWTLLLENIANALPSWLRRTLANPASTLTDTVVSYMERVLG